MNKNRIKLTFTLITLAAVCGLLASPVCADPKFTVEDGADNPVFVVDNLGPVNMTTSATVVSPADYSYMSQESYSDTQWKGGFFIAKRARGTSTAPLASGLNDVVFTFDAQGHDGTTHSRGGQIIGNVDGPVSTGILPMRWSFRTTDTTGATLDRMTVKANGNVGIGTVNPNYLLQLGGGAYSTGSTWVSASSRELKKNIQEVSAEEAIKTVESLKPVSFVYKEGDQDMHVGFIAEDVPEMVATPDRKGLESMDIAAVLTKVVQEQQQAIRNLQDQITALQNALQLKQDKEASVALQNIDR